MTGWDHALFLWLNLAPGVAPWQVTAAQLASLQLPPAMVTTALAVALAGRPDWRAQAWRVLLSMALAALTAALLKRGISAARPFALGLGTQWLPHAASAGFPSAHATAALAFGVSALWLPARWPVRGALLAAALAVAWSRIALGLHFPSDVLAGSALGALCALAVQGLTARAPRRRARAPSPAPAQPRVS